MDDKRRTLWCWDDRCDELYSFECIFIILSAIDCVRYITLILCHVLSFYRLKRHSSSTFCVCVILPRVYTAFWFVGVGVSHRLYDCGIYSRIMGGVLCSDPQSLCLCHCNAMQPLAASLILTCNLSFEVFNYPTCLTMGLW